MFKAGTHCSEGRGAHFLTRGRVVAMRLVFVAAVVATVGAGGAGSAQGKVITHPLLPGQNTGVALQLSSYSARATGVTYSLTFVSPDALTANRSTISIAAPRGTDFPKSACNLYLIQDDTSGQGNACSPATLPSTGKTGVSNTVVIEASVSVSAGDTVTVVLNNVSNPAIEGKTSIRVSTSSDPAPVTLSVSYVKETSVAAATWTNQPVSGSKLTNQLISFVSTSSLTTNGSTITAAGPFAYPTPASNAYGVFDDTTGKGYAGVSATLSHGNQEVQVPVPFRIAAGDEVTLAVHGVGLSKGGLGAPPTELRTSSDPLAVTRSRNTPGFAPPHLVVSSNVAGASDVSYAISFGVPQAIASDKQTIVITMPKGTILPKSGCADYVVSDPEMGISNGCPIASVKSSSLHIHIPLTVIQGEVITISIPSVKNTASSGTFKVAMSDSGAPGGWSEASRRAVGLNGSLPLTLLAEKTGAFVSVSASSRSAGASQVTYRMTFIAPHSLLHNVGLLDLQVPSTFVLPNGSCSSGFTVTDDSLGQYNSCPLVTQQLGRGTSSSAILIPLDVETGDAVTITITGVTNPKLAGSYTWDVSSSADPKPVVAKFLVVKSTGIG
jgi:hypothetical protein